MLNKTILKNARIVTPDEDFIGSVILEDSEIVGIDSGLSHAPEGIDLSGQWLIPGIIDIHSDYFEKELNPRKGANFPIPFAMHYMDARAVNCGITQLYSAISFSEHENKSRTYERAVELSKAIAETSDNLLISHHIHARLDPNHDGVLGVLDSLNELENLKLVVYNDSIPGQRQYPLSRHVEMMAASLNIPQADALLMMQELVAERSKINHREAIASALHKGIVIGSHDDTTEAHVDEAFQFRARLSEMPTTIEAARRAKSLGMWVCMGAPNYYRGGSHCGNLSCLDAMEENLVDILCSDYHFPALIGALVKMIQNGLNPSYAVSLMTQKPAALLNMPQVGAIEVGKQADLVSFQIQHNYAAVHNVFKSGRCISQSNYSVRTGRVRTGLDRSVQNA